MRFGKPFRVEAFTDKTGWLLYALADDMNTARLKAANAFTVTKHTQIRIVEEKA